MSSMVPAFSLVLVASGESYHGVIFRFKHPDGAALGLLWTQEDGEWTLVSYQIFEI